MARGRVGVTVTLDNMQWLELQLGPGSRLSHFRDDDERREAWYAHADNLLADCPPGRRPWGWWAYERTESRYDYRSEAEQLVHLGVVGDAEMRQIEAEWERSDRVAHLHADLSSRVSGRLFFEALRDQRRVRGIPLDRPELEDFERIPTKEEA